MLAAYSAKWFAVYYFCLGVLGLVGGLYFLTRVNRIVNYIEEKTSADTPPPRIRIFLRYFLAFTIPTLVLSFFPFSLIEISFSLWCLFMIYLLGSMLVRWESLHPILMEQTDETIKKYIRIAGAGMLSLGMVMFLLFYRIIQNSF